MQFEHQNISWLDLQFGGLNLTWNVHYVKEMIVIRYVAPYSLIEIDRCYRGTNCLHHKDSDDGGNLYFWKSVTFYKTTAQHPRRLSSLYLLLWEPRISYTVLMAQFLFVFNFCLLLFLGLWSKPSVCFVPGSGSRPCCHQIDRGRSP
jgi:hypothetical protein